MDKTRKIFIGIVFVALVGALLLGVFIGGKTKPFDGEFEDIGLFLVRGDINEVKSFEVCEAPPVGSPIGTEPDCSFKWLVKVTAAAVEELDAGKLVTGLPSESDTVTLEIKDSRFNLFVDGESAKCHGDKVIVCSYDITEEKVTVVIREEIGSSGLPEFSGVTK